MMISEGAFVTVFFIFAICGPIRKTWRLYSVWCAEKRRISDKTDETRYSKRNNDVSIGVKTFDAGFEFTNMRVRKLLEIKKNVAALSLITLLWLLVIFSNK